MISLHEHQATPDQIHLPTLMARLWSLRFVLLVSALVCGGAAMVASLYLSSGTTFDAVVRIEPEVSTTGEQTSLDAEMDVLRSWSLVATTLQDMQRMVWVRRDASQKPSVIAKAKQQLKARLEQPPHLKPEKRDHYPRIEQFAITPEGGYLYEEFRLEMKADGAFELRDPGGNLLCNVPAKRVCRASIAKNGTTHEITAQFDTGTAEHGDKFIITPITTQEMIRSVHEHISVTRLGFRERSGVLMVSFTSGDPVFAEQFLSRYIDHYLRQAYDRSSLGKINALKNLERASEKLEKEIEAIEGAMENFKSAHNIADLSSQGRMLAEDIQRSERAAEELALEISEMEMTYQPAHPALQALLTRKELLREKLLSLQRQTIALPLQERKLMAIKREMETQMRILDVNTRNIAQLRAEVEMITGYARLISAPMAKVRGMFRRTPLFAGAGILIGMLPWFLLALFQAMPGFSRVHSAEELVQFTPLPIIGVFGGDRRMRRRFRWRKRGWVQPSIKDASASTRRMVEELSRQSRFVVSPQQGGRVVALASLAGSGDMTTIACLLSESLARGERVLLMDANLSDPEIHHLYGREDNAGLSDVICGHATIDEALIPSGIANLFLLPAGTPTPNFRLLLEDTRMAALLAPLVRGFDVIVICYPPLHHAMWNPSLFRHAHMVIIALQEGMRTSALAGLEQLGLSQHRGASVLYLQGDV